MKRTLCLLGQAIWIGLCIFALVGAYQGYRGTSDWQVEEGLGFEMIVMSFPASMLVVLALIATRIGLAHFGLALPASGKSEMIATWLLFVVAGYVQWFIVVPTIHVRGKLDK